MKWFDKINSIHDAKDILAGHCLCRHAPKWHQGGQCEIDDCAIECIIPPPANLVEEARRFLAEARRAALREDEAMGEEYVAAFEESELHDILNRAREEGDERTARLAHELLWARDFCDRMRDHAKALAREVRRVFPVLTITVDGDGSVVERVTAPLRAMVAEALDGAPPGLGETGRWSPPESHWALRAMAESLSRTCEPAENFVTMKLRVPAGAYRITVQKPEGKSPADLVAELREECARLTELCERLREERLGGDK